MSEIKGMAGHGTTLSGATFGDVGEITNLSVSGIDTTDIDFTTFDSTNKWREFKAGLKNAGEITVDVFYYTTQANSLIGAIGGSNEAWTISFPDGGSFVCDGHISGVGFETPMDDGITNDITIKLTGQPTTTAGSP